MGLRTHVLGFVLFSCTMMYGCVEHRVPTIDPCFTPGGNCLSAAITEVGKARSEIKINAYSLTAKPLVDALIKARQSGVKVEIILDRGAPNAQNNATYLSTLNGIPTYLDSMHAIADNNVIIVDNETVMCGTFRFTKDADDRNAENMLIVKADAMTASYRANWEEHRSHAQLFKAGAPAVQAASQEQKEQKAVEKKKTKKRKTKAKNN